MSTPREGIHSIRIPIIDVAAADVGLTLAGAYIISKNTPVSFPLAAIGLFGIGHAVHLLLGVRTAAVVAAEKVSPENFEA